MKPTIDVILPYHREDFKLHSAIVSVFSSKNVSVRLILVNDTEEPMASSKIQKFVVENSFKFNSEFCFINCNQKSYAKAINVAKPYLKSDFVALMNSDDLVDPLRFYLQSRKLMMQGGDLCVGKIIKVYKSKTIPQLGGKFNVNFYDSRLLLLGAYGADASIMCKREIWQDRINFDENSPASDWTTALSVYPTLTTVGENRALYFYQMHFQQVTKEPDHMARSAESVFENWTQYSRALNLPEVSQAVAISIFLPGLQLKLSRAEYLDFRTWFKAYLSLDFDPIKVKEIRRIANRRFVSVQFARRRPTWHLITSLRLIFEYLYLKILQISISKNHSA